MRNALMNSKTKTIFTVIIILLVTALLVNPIIYFTQNDESYDEYSFDDGWTITAQGQTFEDVSLSDFQLPHITNKGDVIVLERHLEADSYVTNPVLRVYSVHSVVEVYLDGEKIYEYGREGYEAGKLIGYGNNFIDMPENYMDKDLKIVFTVTEDNAFEGVPTIFVGDGRHMISHVLNEKKVSLMISLSLLMFGFIFMVLSVFVIPKNREFYRVFCIAMFAFATGGWTLCNSDLITVFTSDLHSKVMIEYLCFYFMPLPFTYYFKGRATSKSSTKILTNMFRVLVLFEVAFYITVVTCQFFNIVHFPAFLRTSHVIMLVGGTLLATLIIMDFVKTRHISRGTTLGFVLALITILFEIIRYNLEKYLTGFASNQYDTTLGFATFIIVIALFVDFVDYLQTLIYDAAKQNLLEQMAYEDELTGVPNRRALEEMIPKLNQYVNYAVVDLDMNDLKKINDNYGHEAGDNALKAFADILKEAYKGKEHLVARTGGDEFIVVIPNATHEGVVGHVDKMLKLINDYNNLHSDDENVLPLSTSYGITYRNEMEENADFSKVWEVADDLMYKMKRTTKHQRQDS